MIKPLVNAGSRSIVLEEVTDPNEIAQARARFAQFDLNLAWLKANALKVYRENRGKAICIAGQELFVAETVHEVIAKANAAHPEDKGRFVHYIPKELVPRVYAY